MIHILDEPTINQIAAGEVVERPSAVVKELVENAIDAGSTAITVEIKEGGLSLIRITDNGGGIERPDIPLAFLRHATSKIRSALDLLSVTSLGFRGEALSSIAAVAQVELITKTPSALNGYRYIIEGGNEKSIEEIGCPGGTTILVRNLFYNTPARRNFLKSPTTEAGYISDLMERLLVSHPEISFKYITNNQVKLQSSGNNNRKDILYHVYGRDIAKELLPVDFVAAQIKLSGYIGKPVITRGNRNFENYFINGRYIKSNIITKAIEEAYKPYLMQHKYPFISLYFEIEPSLIDVNVHPQKLEIRIKSSEEVYHLIIEALRSTLSRKEMIPAVTLVNDPEAKEKANILPEPFEANRRKQVIKNEEGLLCEKSDYLLNRETSGIAGQNISGFINGCFTKKPNTTNVDCNPSDTKVSQEKHFSLQERPVSSKEEAVSLQEGTVFSKEEAVTLREGTLYIKEGEVPLKKNSKSSDKETILFQKETDFPNEDAVPVQKEALPSNESIVSYQKENVSSNEGSLSLNEEFISLQENPINLQDNSVVSEPVNQIITSSEQLSLFHSSKVEPETAPFLSTQAVIEHRIIGQVFSTYWLVEYKKELFIIDQHAAHEKVLYEKLMKAAKDKTFESQLLLPPIVLTLTLREQAILKKYETILNQIGYEYEPFGGNEYSVRAVPANLYGLSEKELLLEFLDDLAEEASHYVSNPTSILERVASLSCKAAIKANHTFSMQEAAALIKELLTLDNPYHCPHGRPVIISMSQYELEKKFKRII